MKAPNHIIAYGKLENWIAAVRTGQPIYATLVEETTTGQHGTATRRSFIVCQQPQGNEVHLCRIPVAVTQWLGDQCLNSDGPERQQRAIDAWTFVREWLVQKYGIEIREALIAIPRDYQVLEGQAGFLGYSKERGFFIREEMQA